MGKVILILALKDDSELMRCHFDYISQRFYRRPEVKESRFACICGKKEKFFARASHCRS